MTYRQILTCNDRTVVQHKQNVSISVHNEFLFLHDDDDDDFTSAVSLTSHVSE